jgi:hypothetical protein
MKRLITILTMMIGVSLSSPGQSVVYRFSVQHETNGLVNSLPIVLNGESVRTDQSGNIQLPVPRQKSTIRVSAAGNNAYIILSPFDGQINLPVNASDVIRILVGNKGRNADNETLEKIARLNKQLEKMAAANTQEKKTLQKQINQLLSLGKASPQQLRSARELLDGKDSCFPVIAATLRNYVNESKDLHDAFSQVAQFALNDQRAFDELIKSVNNYNAAFEALNTNKAGYEKAVNAYWQNQELALKFNNLADYALNEVHRTYILPLNSLVEKINRYPRENNRKKREQMKAEIMQTIENETPGLQHRNQILGEKVNEFVTIMNSYTIS